MDRGHGRGPTTTSKVGPRRRRRCATAWRRSSRVRRRGRRTTSGTGPRNADLSDGRDRRRAGATRSARTGETAQVGRAHRSAAGGRRAAPRDRSATRGAGGGGRSGSTVDDGGATTSAARSIGSTPCAKCSTSGPIEGAPRPVLRWFGAHGDQWRVRRPDRDQVGDMLGELERWPSACSSSSSMTTFRWRRGRPAWASSGRPWCPPTTVVARRVGQHRTAGRQSPLGGPHYGRITTIKEGALATISEQAVRALAGFRSDDAPVVSCYLDVDGRRHVRAADYEQHLDQLVRIAKTGPTAPSRRRRPGPHRTARAVGRRPVGDPRSGHVQLCGLGPVRGGRDCRYPCGTRCSSVMRLR